MEELSATATRLLDGASIPLPLKSLNVGWTLDSPAATMSCSLVPPWWMEDVTSVQIRYYGELIFDGGVDAQRNVMSQNGLLTELEARSKGAKLLDNEAMPCTMYSLSTSALFNATIKPYGFLLVDPSPKPSVAEYTVPKGISEWEAFCAFSRLTHGIDPYILNEQVMMDYATSLGALEIGDGYMPITRIENKLCPYNAISQVAQRGSTGNYIEVVNNQAAINRGVSRRRYLVPQSELARLPVADARKRIHRSMFDMEETIVTMSGVWRFNLGQLITIAHPLVNKYNLIVTGVSHHMDETGATTKLNLRSTVYYYPTASS